MFAKSFDLKYVTPLVLDDHGQALANRQTYQTGCCELATVDIHGVGTRNELEEFALLTVQHVQDCDILFRVLRLERFEGTYLDTGVGRYRPDKQLGQDGRFVGRKIAIGVDAVEGFVEPRVIQVARADEVIKTFGDAPFIITGFPSKLLGPKLRFQVGRERTNLVHVARQFYQMWVF